MAEKRSYYFHVDVNPVERIRKGERRQLTKELLDFARKSSERYQGRPKLSEEVITIRIGNNEMEFWVEDFVHMAIYVDKPTEQAFSSLNQSSNEFLGYVTTQPNRGVRNVEVHAEADSIVENNLIPNFIQPSEIANLRAALRMSVRPTGLAFGTKQAGASVLFMLLEDGRKHKTSISYDKKFTDIPWDILQNMRIETDKNLELLNKLVLRGRHE